MKPLSNHWADLTAARIVRERGELPVYVVASGITPSGRVHFGNFREVITVDLVAQALRDLGKTVRFIYSWDNFDTFRKVPAHVADPESFANYLRQPIARIPDPWGDAPSYAAGRIAIFESELAQIGIAPQFLYQEEKYSRGEYGDAICHALDHVATIREVLNAHRTQPLDPDWLPVSVYCANCHRDTTTTTYLGHGKLAVTCCCGRDEQVDVRRSTQVKLVWRVDWPMRWAHENVDFESGGKDHSSQGGSFDTASQLITAVWGKKPPVYLQYDFVGIKGGSGKMSSSSGDNITLGEVLEVFEPAIVRWIFAHHRPNHDFSVGFDEDVIKLYDEFDLWVQRLAVQAGRGEGKWESAHRSLELSGWARRPHPQQSRPPFRRLCDHLQICNLDPERTYHRFYHDTLPGAAGREVFDERACRAVAWLRGHAPAAFVYAIRDKASDQPPPETLQPAIAALVQLLRHPDFATWNSTDLNSRIYDEVIHRHGVPAGDFFRWLYQALIGRDRGPKLAGFLLELGNEKVLQLLGPR